ncbi:diiron oxygenase [Nocardia sp. NPDC058497]|uniref:diiron oxygenase n=1 Tax=Nocardia sp. NPDC058497 TaxID=3346529 RepID=UPI00364AEACA
MQGRRPGRGLRIHRRRRPDSPRRLTRARSVCAHPSNYQKALIRSGHATQPTLLRIMEIHIAEEARHTSFANEFLRAHLARMNPVTKQLWKLLKIDGGHARYRSEPHRLIPLCPVAVGSRARHDDRGDHGLGGQA